MNKFLFTSESVGPGHPDKICDQISDRILDECLKQDENSKVACEVFASNHLIIIGGEITTAGYVDVVKIAWDVIKPLGYNENDFTIISNVNKQSDDINQAVFNNGIINAGDQGIVFGYACDETENMMPISITLANELVKEVTNSINDNKFSDALYDMKSQVTIEYEENIPVRINTILMSVQHKPNYDKEKFKEFIKNIMLNVAKKYHMNLDFDVIINPSGKFVIGGPIGDTGLTGRKIIVDTYGGVAHHGGGAFSGKDCSKVDRSGAYFARYIAKNIVAAKLANKCEVQLAFGIGLPKPIALYINTFNTCKVNEAQLLEVVKKVFDFSINEMIKKLDLKKPQYAKLATFGHFGRDELNLSWEKLDKVDELRKHFNV